MPSLEEKQFDFTKWVNSLLTSKQRHLQVIGRYALHKNPRIENKGQGSVFIKRNVRPAKDLAPYSDDRIDKTMREVEGEEYIKKWTLETVLKFIDEV